MHPISVVIITYNEEKNIKRCIESVKKIANEVIVVDSFSDDNTVNIAVAMGAVVKQSKFDGYINQKNKAIALATNNYVLLLDADESLSDELASSILLEKKSFTFKAYAMKRCNIFAGTPITVTLGGTSFTTTAPAPTIESGPIEIPCRTTAPTPI